MSKKWIGSVVNNCDVCKTPIKTWWVDGKTIYGYWANMCPKCYSEMGCGLGTGFGQKYDHKTYKKIEG